MEKKLVKAGVYGLMIGLMFSLLYFDDVRTVQNNGLYTSYTIPIREYVFLILRTSIKISIATMISVWFVDLYKNGEKSSIKKDIAGKAKFFFVGILMFSFSIFVLNLVF